MSKGRHDKINGNQKISNEKKQHVISKSKRIRKTNTQAKNRIFLTIIFLIIFFYSGFKLIRWYIDNKNSKQLTADINEKVVMPILESKNETKNFNISVDFDELCSINNDVVGYIEIPNTLVQYPILQSKDNEYYLTRDIYKRYNSCGSIFMDCSNNKFNSQNTVLYGHNMKSGLMFATLNDIYNNKYGKDIVVNIYTTDFNVQYKPFAIYITEPTKDPIKTTLSDEKAFIEKAMKMSNIDFGILPNSNDNILTLSTCNGSGEKRTILHAVKILQEPNN